MPARLGGIQVLRAGAALLVLLFHLQAYEAQASAAPLLPGALTGGALGVDLFFVISGFVMVYAGRGGFGAPRAAGVFLYNRAARIYPPVWLFTGLAVLGYALRGDLGEQLGEGPRMLASSLLLLPQAELPLLPVAWTLIHEMYFYAVFAALMLAPARWLPWALAVWAGLVMAGALAGLRTGPWSGLALSPLTLEFVAGAGAGLLVCSGRRRWAAGALALGAALLLLAMALMTSAAAFEDSWRRTLLAGPAAVLLVYGAACLEIDGGWRAPGWGVALGDWSYALYLSHMLALAGLAAAWGRVETAGPLDNLLWIAGAPVVCVAIAAATFILFERPALRLLTWPRRRWFDAPELRNRPELASRIW